MQKPKNYGLPYMGSKNAIVDKFFPLFPKAKHFYDLFGGGGAVTHYALLSNKYEQVHYNDISDIGELFSDAVSGRYANETRWISREDFFDIKDKEPYIRAVWSFGNSGKGYMYSREVEPWKRALHYARVFGDCSEFRKMGIETDGTRGDIIKNMPEYKQKYIAWFTANNPLQSCRGWRQLKPTTDKSRLSLTASFIATFLIVARENMTDTMAVVSIIQHFTTGQVRKVSQFLFRNIHSPTIALNVFGSKRNAV